MKIKDFTTKALESFTPEDLVDAYTEYQNNFLTVEFFAEYHGWALGEARAVIEQGRKAQDAYAEFFKALGALR